MRKVITYGTFDMFHYGHERLLIRAKSLGDYLIVGVTSKSYDEDRGKLNVSQSLVQRVESVKKTGLADEIIIEEYEGQKINDILSYGIDLFVVGSDWNGKFDYLKKYCEVTYLERTKGISSTQIRKDINGLIKIGICGPGRIARRFLEESKYVSGFHVIGAYGSNLDSTRKFVEDNDLEFYEEDFDSFIKKIDAIYISSPHLSHYEYTKKALLNGKHVLCEKPITLSKNETIELYELASKKNLVLLEAIKTAYCPGFINLINLVRTGVIGDVKIIDATFTKIALPESRELSKNARGGSVTELSSYPLLLFNKILGENYSDVSYYSWLNKEKIDLFTKITLIYSNAIATGKVGVGLRTEGDCIITGTKGYIYVPSPWWKTQFFEVRLNDEDHTQRHFSKFEKDGLRYELSEFLSMITKGDLVSYKLNSRDSIFISEIIETFLYGKKNHYFD